VFVAALVCGGPNKDDCSPRTWHRGQLQAVQAGECCSAEEGPLPYTPSSTTESLNRPNPLQILG